MTGFITAEGLVIPAGSDTYDYVADQRRLSSSIRSIVPVPDQATGDTIAAAMATDGRAVSDTNPLVTWQADQQAINIKGTNGWHPKYTTQPVFSPIGWTNSGTYYLLPFGDRTLVTFSGYIYRNGSTINVSAGASYLNLLQVAPSTVWSAIAGNISWVGYVAGAGAYDEFQFVYIPQTGFIECRGEGGAAATFPTGAQMNFQLTYIM